MFAVGIPSAISTVLFDLDYVVIDKLMVSYHDLAFCHFTYFTGLVLTDSTPGEGSEKGEYNVKYYRDAG